MNATIDIFETRSMIQALHQMKLASRFLLDTFFTRVEQSLSTHVDIDIIKDKRRVAPFIAPTSESKQVDRIGFKTNSYTPPYIKLKMATTAQDFLKRSPGETIYGPQMSALQRAAFRVGEDLATLDQMITRREELMCAQVLQTGKVRVLGDGVDDTVDYGFDSTHLPTLVGGAVWDSVNSTPFDDLHSWRRIVLQDSGMLPTDAILGSSAADALLNNVQTKDRFNKWWMNMGQFDVRQTDKHVIHLGYIKELAMDFWLYNEFYIDPVDGVEKPIFDDKKIALVCKDARMSRHYGAIQDVEADVTMAVPRFPKSWTIKDPSSRIIMLQSAPLVAAHQPDAHFCAQVLA